MREARLKYWHRRTAGVKKTKKSLRKKGTAVNAQTTEMLTEKNIRNTNVNTNANTGNATDTIMAGWLGTVTTLITK